jgi:hypothetical protein
MSQSQDGHRHRHTDRFGLRIGIGFINWHIHIHGTERGIRGVRAVLVSADGIA